MIWFIIKLWLLLGLLGFLLFIIETHRWGNVHIHRFPFWATLYIMAISLQFKQVLALLIVILLGPIGIYYIIMGLEGGKKQYLDDEENKQADNLPVDPPGDT